ncbi:MAG TPA: hypothetical protein VNL39_06065 [Xanthobacteraceae bacterium]|nr:hypothetical protein [Xanthobacteraceae bacterium]
MMSEKSNEKTELGRDDSGNPDSASLDRRYGKIGIPAVAAALRYTTSRPARPATTGVVIQDRFIELAA